MKFPYSTSGKFPVELLHLSTTQIDDLKKVFLSKYNKFCLIQCWGVFMQMTCMGRGLIWPPMYHFRRSPFIIYRKTFQCKSKTGNILWSLGGPRYQVCGVHAWTSLIPPKEGGGGHNLFHPKLIVYTNAHRFNGQYTLTNIQYVCRTFP